MDKRQKIEDEWPEDCGLLFANDFDEAIIGVGSHWGLLPDGGMTQTEAVVYDYQKCIEILERDMSYEEAVEFLHVNTLGAYNGPNTPIFVNVMSDED